MRYLKSLFSYSRARNYLVKKGDEGLVKLIEKGLPGRLGRVFITVLAFLSAVNAVLLRVLLAVALFVAVPAILFQVLQPFFESLGWDGLIVKGFTKEFLADDQWVASLTILLMIFGVVILFRHNQLRRDFSAHQQDMQGLQHDMQRKHDYLVQRLDSIHGIILGRSVNSGALDNPEEGPVDEQPQSGSGPASGQ